MSQRVADEEKEEEEKEKKEEKVEKVEKEVNMARVAGKLIRWVWKMILKWISIRDTKMDLK